MIQLAKLNVSGCELESTAISERNLTKPNEVKMCKLKYSAIPLVDIFDMENPTKVHNESNARRTILAHVLSKNWKDTVVTERNK